MATSGSAYTGSSGFDPSKKYDWAAEKKKKDSYAKGVRESMNQVRKDKIMNARAGRMMRRAMRSGDRGMMSDALRMQDMGLADLGKVATIDSTDDVREQAMTEGGLDDQKKRQGLQVMQGAADVNAAKQEPINPQEELPPAINNAEKNGSKINNASENGSLIPSAKNGSRIAKDRKEQSEAPEDIAAPPTSRFKNPLVEARKEFASKFDGIADPNGYFAEKPERFDNMMAQAKELGITEDQINSFLDSKGIGFRGADTTGEVGPPISDKDRRKIEMGEEKIARESAIDEETKRLFEKTDKIFEERKGLQERFDEAKRSLSDQKKGIDSSFEDIASYESAISDLKQKANKSRPDSPELAAQQKALMALEDEQLRASIKETEDRIASNKDAKRYEELSRKVKKTPWQISAEEKAWMTNYENALIEKENERKRKQEERDKMHQRTIVIKKTPNFNPVGKTLSDLLM